MANEQQEIHRIHPIQQALQVPARAVVDILFPRQKLDPESQKNLEKAAELLEDGYGEVVPIDHYGKREFDDLYSELFKNRAFSERGGLMLLGAHEYYRYITGFAKAVGVDTMPVILYPGRKAMGMGDIKSRGRLAGMQEFMEAMAKRLACGGTVLAMPQGHRLPRLGEAQSTLISDLLSTAEDYEGAKKLAVLPIGIGLLGNPNYQDQGFHFFERGVVTVRPPKTREEINNITGGKPRDIESWVFEELRAAVPANYR